MKKILSAILFVQFFFLCSSAAFAAGPLANYAGTWKNVNASTGNITKVQVTVTGTIVKVRAWGKCTPSDCDWGELSAYAYGIDVGANLTTSTVAITAMHEPGFSVTILVLQLKTGGILNVNSYKRFTDGSGRTGYTKSEDFKKDTIAIAEDCVSMNPLNVTVRQSGNLWLIVDGNHSIFSAPNRTEAEKIVRIIKYYRLNKSCFVGRPDPSFTYMTKDGVPPSGAVAGEDCISFSPGSLSIRQEGSQYLLTDGSSRMFMFPNREEAEQTLAIIRKYGFTKSCFIGRPDSSLQYMRK